VQNIHDFIAQMIDEGYTVRADEHGADPDLIAPDGRPVESWREDDPYDVRMTREEYEEQKYLLQVELLKLQYWTLDHGHKHVIVFEGRDAARAAPSRVIGSTEPLHARVVAPDLTTAAGSVVLPAARVAAPRPARSCSSTGPGTTAPTWNS
jgi:polyphosphate kinase 2 (PPK2 family)